MTTLKYVIGLAIMGAWLTAGSACADDAKASVIPQPIPTPGLVTLVDLGAHKCIPCKMMAPILAELQQEYSGRASIIFIDVWENPELAQRFRVRAIPTQIFYNMDGEESGRHVGFLNRESIVSVFEKLGVPGQEAP